MIICAAIEVNNTVICGYRHADCYEALFRLAPNKSMKDATEGFLATGNRFLDRHAALVEALNCGQISATVREYKINHFENALYSEDLY